MGQKVTTTIRGQRYDIHIRGWCVNQYIITDGPLVNGEPIRLAPHTGCDVHFIREGEFVTFKTNVMFVSPHVVTLMILEYPRSFDKTNLRKTERLKASFPMSYTLTVANQVFTETGIIRDLSYTGALITHKKPLQKDNKILLSASLDSGMIENIDTVVQNVRHNPKSEKEPYVTGVKFANLAEPNRAVLQKFIENRIELRQKVLI
ncbi:MAG: PilZ domain-containing protein [Nitrospinae bacterium]|nr:PilZ domain-containing protein [Nitrospinota bacterium]